MKNIILLICIISLGIVLFSPVKHEESLRLRVIGNSDSEEDLKTKFEVVNAVDHMLDKSGFKTLDAAELWIQENMSDIKDTCESVLNGGEYEIELRDEIYPEGVWRSLVITLGEGKGHNFWGTLFPDIALRASGARGEKGKSFFVIAKGTDLIEGRFWLADKFLNIF
jgi:stage II sporulation protein R